MTLTTLKDFYLKIKVASGISPLTYEYYDKTTNMFIKYLGDIESNSLTFEHITNYLQHLRTVPTINSVSVQTYARGAKCFVSWLAKNDYCDMSVFVKFKLPKAEKPIINVLTDDEQKRLFGCFDLGDTLGLRNFIICSLLFGSGLRRAEVVNLRSANVFEDYIIVLGKGNKERLVPIPNGMYKLIRRYQNIVGVNEFLFVQHNGTPIQITTVKNLFTRLKKQSGISRLGMHLLRHTFATMYFENGGSIFNLSRILGHSNLEITKRYMHLSRKTLLQDFNEYTPLQLDCI